MTNHIRDKITHTIFNAIMIYIVYVYTRCSVRDYPHYLATWNDIMHEAHFDITQLKHMRPIRQ